MQRALVLWISAVMITSAAFQAKADDQLPPFDFSDAFYLSHGINPSTIIGRPNGTPPNSIIDNRENGPDYNNVRLLQQSAAYDHSGHRVFFSVTGLPTSASFTNNAAGRAAFQTAESFKVYEFPRAANAQFSVFPKRQDLIADMRNGYFSNDPLGTWQINIVRYTSAALNTRDGQDALAELARRNGLDLDGTPIIRTLSEIEGLLDDGFVSIITPPLDGSGGFRWFFCPVIQDPRNGAIAPDAHLDVTESSDADAFRHLFQCLQVTGDDACSLPVRGDLNSDGRITAADASLLAQILMGTNTGTPTMRYAADVNADGVLDGRDIQAFVQGL